MALKEQFSLRNHQEDAGDTTLKRDGNIIFSHPVGSGKTLTSISAFERLKAEGKANRALVVTPASLRTNYGENGVKKFTDSDYKVYGNKQEISSDKTGIFSEPSAHGPEYGVVSYELFREDPEKYIRGHNADTVIFDEVHRIKNDGSKTFKALKDSRGSFRNFIGMTGSIASNTPADVVPLIDAMTNGNHRLGTKAAFENRYVSTDKNGNKTLVNKILVRALLAPYVHHVSEEQVNSGSSLKPPKKEIREVRVPMSDEHAQYYRYVINELDPVTKAKLAYGVGKLGKAELDGLFSKMLKSRQVVNSIATINPHMSIAESAIKSTKVKKLLDDVEEHLQTVPDAQVVIHSELIKGGLDVIEAGLKMRGIEYGKFIGKGNDGVTEKSRQQDVDDYNSGKKKVIVLSAAGGEGLDLPNTTLVASLDGHWNPEKINQVEARGVRMGGLSHRPESERKVIVNRYISTLPIAKLDVAKNIWHNINPDRVLGRALSGEKLFFNPIKDIPTVDQLMYRIAKQKAQGNDELKDMFVKTSAYSFNSDKDILTEYLDKYQDKLLTGDYQDKYIDPVDENKYLNRLRRYYSSAKGREVVKVSPSDYNKYKERTRLGHAARNFGMTAGVMGPFAGGYAYLRGFPAPISAGFGAVAGIASGAMAAYQADKPHVTTAKTDAGKMLKLKDEDLLRILRGEAITEEKVKKTDLFIKMK
jgi:superfamily II DNA/RNA helicase